MTASELRELAEHIKWYSGQIWSPDDSRKLAIAAELIELLAWAEENKIDVQRGQFFWWSRNLEDGQGADKTLIGLLRRAREAAR